MPDNDKTDPSKPAATPSLPDTPGVRLATQARETVTDVVGTLALVYLARCTLIPGQWALVGILCLLLPQPLLSRLAQLFGARFGVASGGAAAAMVTVGAAIASVKAAAASSLGAGAIVGAVVFAQGCTAAQGAGAKGFLWDAYSAICGARTVVEPLLRPGAAESSGGAADAGASAQ